MVSKEGNMRQLHRVPRSVDTRFGGPSLCLFSVIEHTRRFCHAIDRFCNGNAEAYWARIREHTAHLQGGLR